MSLAVLLFTLALLAVFVRLVRVWRIGSRHRMTARAGVRSICFMTLAAVFLYVPLFLLIVFSFNDGATLAFPLSGFTLKWYRELGHAGIAAGCVEQRLAGRGLVRGRHGHRRNGCG